MGDQREGKENKGRTKEKEKESFSFCDFFLCFLEEGGRREARFFFLVLKH